jgi:hypothetical protein
VHENPHEVAERHFQCRLSVNVWCGILGNYLIKKHFTAAYYKGFLQNDLSLYLEYVPLATRR